MKGRLRTFIAIELSEEIKTELDAYIRKIGADDRNYKRVAKDNLHITMAFLGEMEYDDIQPVASAMERSVKSIGTFSARIGKVGTFRSVVWVGLKNGREECGDIFGNLRKNLDIVGFHLDTISPAYHNFTEPKAYEFVRA